MKSRNFGFGPAYTLSPVLLRFKDSALEKEFRLQNDYKVRLYNRIGKCLCFLSWVYLLILITTGKADNYLIATLFVFLNMVWNLELAL